MLYEINVNAKETSPKYLFIYNGLFIQYPSTMHEYTIFFIKGSKKNPIDMATTLITSFSKICKNFLIIIILVC